MHVLAWPYEKDTFVGRDQSLSVIYLYRASDVFFWTHQQLWIIFERVGQQGVDVNGSIHVGAVPSTIWNHVGPRKGNNVLYNIRVIINTDFLS